MSEQPAPERVEQDPEDALQRAVRRIRALEHEVAALQSTAARAIAKRDKHKAKAARWKAQARRLRTHVAKLETQARRDGRCAPVDAEPPSQRGDLPVPDDAPDATWTVARLRAAARERGVPGSSRMTKTQLLDVLIG